MKSLDRLVGLVCPTPRISADTESHLGFVGQAAGICLGSKAERFFAGVGAMHRREVRDRP